MSETSVSVLPREVLLKAKFVDDENVDVEYTETFRPEEAALGDRTFEIMKPAAEYVGLKIERLAPETIKPSGVMTSTIITSRGDCRLQATEEARPLFLLT